MKKKNKQCTRERIINAAGELFAERGFASATVRDICKKAETNVAAVNYHFSSKEHLFEETLKSVIKKQWEKFPPDMDQDKAKTPEEKLKTFISVFFKRKFDCTVPTWFGNLMISETFAFRQTIHQILKKNIEKNRSILGEIVREILGQNAPQQAVSASVMSIIGQIIIFMKTHSEKHCFTSLVEVSPDNIDYYIEHVYRFALGGVMEVKKTRAAAQGGDRRKRCEKSPRKNGEEA